MITLCLLAILLVIALVVVLIIGAPLIDVFVAFAILWLIFRGIPKFFGWLIRTITGRNKKETTIE